MHRSAFGAIVEEEKEKDRVSWTKRSSWNFLRLNFSFRILVFVCRDSTKGRKLLMFNSRPIVIFVKRGNFKLEICTVIKRTLCKNVFELLVG